MKVFIIFSVLVFIGPIIVVSFLDKLPTASDLSLDKDANIYVGEGEVCENPYSKINCQEGLVCTAITEKPYRTAVCLPPGTKFEEDLSYRYAFENITVE